MSLFSLLEYECLLCAITFWKYYLVFLITGAHSYETLNFESVRN